MAPLLRRAGQTPSRDHNNRSQMEIYKVEQCYNFIDGKIQFVFSKVILKKGSQLYYTRSRDRIPPSSIEINIDDLEVTPIPIESYCPIPPLGASIAPNPLPSDCYVKRPKIILYGEGLDLSELVLREIEACENLKRNPHPNIAHYYGCQLYQGRVVGLCFKKYPQTLMEMMNPSHLNKLHFISKEDRCDNTEADHYISGIENGLRHMHSLGLVHNDINPGNIMVDNETAIISDFDSTSKEGEPLGKIKRTYGWHSPEELLSRKEHDSKAVAEIQTWLTGTLASEFQFE